MKFHNHEIRQVPDPEKSEMELENLIEHPEKSSPTRLIKKFLILSPVVLLVLVIAYSSPLSDYLSRVSEISGKIRGFGIAGPIVFIAAMSILVAIGFPRLIFCPIAGITFGFVAGLAYSVIGSLIAYYAVFLFVRWSRNEFGMKNKEEHQKIMALIKKGGIPAVILARQVPVHGMVVNIILGLSPVKHVDFLFGTAIGLIPEAAPCTLFGSSAAQGSLQRSIIYLAVAVVFIAVLWIGLIVYTNRRKKKLNLVNIH